MSQTVTVINTGNEPLMLDDGTQVGAAHTPEARREGVTLSESDRRRYVDTDSPRLLVIEQPPVAAERPRAAPAETHAAEPPNRTNARPR